MARKKPTPSTPEDVARDAFREAVANRAPRAFPELASLARDLSDLHIASLQGNVNLAIEAAVRLSLVERRVEQVKPAIFALRRMAAAARAGEAVL